MNTDQGSQLTSINFIKTLNDADVRVSLDRNGAWRYTVFVELIWRKIKYEEFCLRAYDGVSAARDRLRRYLTVKNGRRPRSSLDGQTPDQANLNPSRPIQVAVYPSTKST